MRRRLLLATGLVLLAGVAATAAALAGGDAPRATPLPKAALVDWPTFGFDAARSSSGPAVTGITAANVKSLHRRQFRLDGTVDAAPIYLNGVSVRGKAHDVFVVTTTYGKTEALDATSGKVLWEFTPPGFSGWAGSAQVTNTTPVADPSRKFVYAASPDGRIHKLSLSTGAQVWSTLITKDATHEKMTSALNFSKGLVIATTGGYIGDAPPYQGHVVTLYAASGKIDHVWNSLCSARHALITPSTCASSDSAIWSKGGAGVDPETGNLVVATGNAPWNGSTDWGDSVVVLSPNASTMLKHYTPATYDNLNKSDLDLGSTSPVFLNGGYIVQSGGKDGVLRLLNLKTLPGPSTKTGGEVQTMFVPGPTMVFAQPAVYQGKWVFVADSAGTEGLLLSGGKLHVKWSNKTGGTSPVVAGGLLYVATSGGVNVYVPFSGRLVAKLPVGSVHWQSPIVAAGRVAVAEGSYQDHAQSGVLDVFSR
jgi:outer membrane protein assembly factor BamB